MRLGQNVSPDQVVATYLRGQLDSSRFRARLLELIVHDGVDVAIVAEPDLADDAANSYRSDLLLRLHAWLRADELGPFPFWLEWSRAGLSPEEVLEIGYMDWDWWVRISGGTRLPREAAVRLWRGEIPGGDPEWHEPIAAALSSDKPPPELIVLAPPDHSRLVILEGHVRLTAYALFPQYLPDELEILLGVSKNVTRWWPF